MTMDFTGRHVVVHRGPGALGTAIVGALLQAGAFCHVPYRKESEAQRFPHRQNKNVTFYSGIELADEAAVAGLFDKVPQLWASIHAAGGFGAGAVAKTGKSGLMAQIDGNLVSCFLCCKAVVNSFARGQSGGRIVNVAARAALER